MNKHFVVSAIGRDRPGLINIIAHEIKNAAGNIELQRSQIMAGDFALLMLVSVDPADGSAHAAMQRLTTLGNDDLSILVREAHGIEELSPGSQYAELLASGIDQPGLIEMISLYLVRENVNVAKMCYEVSHAPMTSTALFSMSALVIVPGSVECSDFRKMTKDMERNLGIEVVYKYPISPDDIDW